MVELLNEANAELTVQETTETTLEANYLRVYPLGYSDRQ